jgi:hypothetical protein
LTGEQLSGSQFHFEGVCNPGGASTFTFTASGVADGPISGAFTESGTVTFDADGRILTFNASFTITAGATTVVGTKSLDFGGGDAIGLGKLNRITLGVPVNYRATVFAPEGHVVVTGIGMLEANENLLNPAQNSFVESYS